MKENINILIESKENLNDETFKKEILSYGNVIFFDDNNNIFKFECSNKNMTKIGNYKCFDVKSKSYL